MTRCIGRVLSLACVGVVFTVPAAAQQVPSVVVSGGYEQFRGFGPPPNSAERWGGWYADVASPVRTSVAIVGEVTEHRNTFDQTFEPGSLLTRVHVDSRFRLFLGGVRAAARHRRGVVPFVQALAGVAVASGKGTAEGNFGIGTQTASSSETRGAMEIGGGVDVMPMRRIGFRLSANYLRLVVEGAPNIWIYRGGVVVALGR